MAVFHHQLSIQNQRFYDDNAQSLPVQTSSIRYRADYDQAY